ncbi:MAG: hypothetical protein JWP97_5551 [Labilithrix sp.]|nr:hypothetical protein [Labilithrix sp.]
MRPSRAPAGVPSGGNGKFILLAVLLLGAIGAIIGWRACQKPDGGTTIVVADAAPPPRPTKNPDDDIPPPPVVEDAAPADDGGKKTNTVQLSNQCDVKQCTGTATTDVESALAFRAKQSHRCYDNALAQDPTLRGKMSISVRIGANGQACSASATNNELASNPGVATCVVNNFRSTSFPAPKGGCVDVSVPINFVPRQ